MLRGKIPELQDRTPVGEPAGNLLGADAYNCSSEKAERVLGVRFRTREETFGELGTQLLEIEGR